jgi:predicted ATPase
VARQEEFLIRTDTVQRHDLSFESVREQLSRILGSPTFSNAPSLSRLLRHLVEHSFQGSTDQLKEYTVGVEVFDRGESFDPRTDTIVRVQARQLRSKLEEYYRAEGRADSIVIEVPKGHYVASFLPVPSAPSGQHFPRSEVVSRDGIREVHSQFLPPVSQPLPAPATPLIGREPELAAVKQLLLREGVRLATLTGAGGSGKTRLGLQVVTDLVDKFPGGVYFIALASIADPDTVASTIAKVLGVRHTGGRSPVEAMQDHLRLLVHAPTLLLLDNFEHLLAAAPLPVKLLEACAQLKVLVTSRAVLHVYGEHEYPLPPLPLPVAEQLGSLQLLSKNPAITLFVDRANAVKAEFKLTEENARLIAQICCRLDGLPLAIELAAARIKMLPPKALLQRLENRLEILTGGARDLPARQQTLRNTIDWSHDLLSAAEQKLFRRLCVFAGGCTLEGIEAVCNTRLDLGVDVLDGMSSLVDKSLLQRVGAKEGESRFVMLETLREYGLERLAESGEEEATRRAHAAYFLVLAEESKLPLTRPEWTDWLTLCDAEHDNLRAALDWLIASDNSEWALRLGLALNWFWELREHFVEGRERLEAILRKKGAQVRTKAWAKAAGHAGGLASVQGDYDGALRLHQEALDVYRELDDQIGIVKQLSSVGLQKHFQGDYVAARPWFEHCLQACRELGDRSEIACALSNLADVVNAQGEHVLARSLLEEAMSISRELGDQIGVAWCISHLGDVARDRGDLAEARRLYQQGADIFRRQGEQWGMARSSTDLGYLACDQDHPAIAHSLFEEALRIFLELGHKQGIAKVLEGFACLATHQNNPERALTLAGAAGSLRQRIGAPARFVEQAKLDATPEPAWQHGDSASAKAAWVAGWRMRLEEAIQYALDGPYSKPAMPTEN